MTDPTRDDTDLRAGITEVVLERQRHVLALRTHGATVRVALEGAHVLSFVPAGGRDVFWVSPVWPDPPTPLRGGVPVCWPWFARQGVDANAPQHGHARQARWRVTQQHFDAATDRARVVMAPEQRLEGLGLQIEITLDGHAGELAMRLTTTAPADGGERTITQALHNYFAVADASRLQLLGLGGQRYIDNLAAESVAVATEPMPVALPCERIHIDGSGRYELVDPAGARRLRIESEGSASLVVWHPGADAAARYAEIPGDQWRQFVCCEVANAAPDRIRIAPGASHTLGQRIRVIEENGRQAR